MVRVEVDTPVNDIHLNHMIDTFNDGYMEERRGSVVVSTSARHAADRGSIPGPGTFNY